uniref:Lipoprotein n=1 Tax=Geobacter sp. (strain M21) TaxID=443144 RepID=C6E0X6_GEOSM
MNVSRFLSTLCLLLLAFFIWGCSDSSNNQQNASDDVNLAYQNDLKQGRYVELPEAQPRFPASGELFSENTGVFDLFAAAPDTIQKKLTKDLAADFALYATTAPATKRLASAVAGTTPGGAFAGIPSLKGQDALPGSCTELTGDELQECLAEFGVEPLLQSPGSAPPPPAPPAHVSMHDSQTLAIEAGQPVVDSIAGKTIRTLTTNVTKARRDAIVAGLSDFTNDDQAHADFDLAALDPFNPSGYHLSSVVVSDGSSSYVNDGGLTPHSTMITEVVKPLNYHRSPAPALDACVRRYGGDIEDRYVVKVTTYVHLDSLAPQRQPVSLPTTLDADAVDLPEAYEAVHTAQAINHALDANVIKWVYGSAGNLPESATEYTFSFQLDANLISKEYRQVIEQATDAGDSACQEVVEQHVNPRTAIIGRAIPVARGVQKASEPMNVFYQVPSSFSQGLTAKVAAALTGEAAPTSYSEPLRDYCMVDANGRKVAIVHPVSGAVVPACEKFDQQALAKTVLMTKSGACRDNRGNWAYTPSRIRTERFGRGIQWILTEWFLHNQVGDYKNIHWYQNSWKSGVQVAVKGAKYVFATYLKIQLGAIKPKADEKRSTYYIKSLLPLIKDVVMKMNGMNVAGYRLSIPSSVGNFLTRAGGYSGSDSAFGNATFDTQLALELRQGITGFLVDRVTDAAAQMVDVSATGWQDISDRSHYGCFQFSY